MDCGITEGEPLGHAWVEATCQAPRTCSVCEATEGEKAPHYYDENGDCTVCHARRIELTWENVDDYLAVTYSTDSLDHVYERIIVTVAPVSGNDRFEDVQIHIGVNLLGPVSGNERQIYYDTPLDFNSDNREVYYDVDSEGYATIEGYFPKDYELDFTALIYDVRGYCIRE